MSPTSGCLQGHCIFSGPPSAADNWFAQRGLPCPVGTAVAEHMLDAVSDPASLEQLLRLHSKDQQQQQLGPYSGSAAAAGATADGMLPVPLTAYVSGRRGSGSSESISKLDGEPGGHPHSRPGSSMAEQQPQQQYRQQYQRSISRELAVVFWRTLVDIIRNPALLLLHW